MIVWALFDSGNGCYSQAAKNFPEIELYSIGLDKEHKNDHFINLNLATYSIDGKANPLFKSAYQVRNYVIMNQLFDHIEFRRYL